MISAISWALAVCGLTYGISRSVYGAPLRLVLQQGTCVSSRGLRLIATFLTLAVYCGICTGFWVGFWLSWIWDWSPLYASHQAELGRAALSGLGGSALCGLWFRVADTGADALESERKLVCGGADEP